MATNRLPTLTRCPVVQNLARVKRAEVPAGVARCREVHCELDLVLMAVCTLDIPQPETAPRERRVATRIPDIALANALIAGAPGAPSAAWARFSPIVRRMLTRFFGRNREVDVDDMVHDVFLIFFQRVASLRDPLRLEQFLVGITLRVKQRELRLLYQRRRRALPLEHQESVDRRNPGDSLEAREALALLRSALSRMKTRDREAFLLRHVDECDPASLARALGTSQPTARRSLGRARKRLQRLGFSTARS